MNINIILVWHNRDIEISYQPHKFVDMDHIEIRSRDGLPLPITATGYHSHFTSAQSSSMSSEEVIGLITGWLDEMEQSSDWQKYLMNSRQLDLF